MKRTFKKMILCAVSPLLLTALQINVSAQSIKGRVIDENDEPLAYANVMLQKADSTYLGGAMTDTLGVFVLETAPQAAMVNISFIGYEPYITEVHGSDMGTIRMVPDSEMLSKAVVKGLPAQDCNQRRCLRDSRREQRTRRSRICKRCT